VIAGDALDFALRAREHRDPLVQLVRLYVEEASAAIGRGTAGFLDHLPAATGQPVGVVRDSTSPRFLTGLGQVSGDESGEECGHSAGSAVIRPPFLRQCAHSVRDPPV